MELLIPSYELIILTFLLFFLFIITLIDVLRHKFEGNNDKLIWVLVTLFVPILGSVLYWTIGRSNRIRSN
jgi:hypothetical protein